jgi:hypothetical protein
MSAAVVVASSTSVVATGVSASVAVKPFEVTVTFIFGKSPPPFTWFYPAVINFTSVPSIT